MKKHDQPSGTQTSWIFCFACCNSVHVSHSQDAGELLERSSGCWQVLHPHQSNSSSCNTAVLPVQPVLTLKCLDYINLFLVTVLLWPWPKLHRHDAYLKASHWVVLLDASFLGLAKVCNLLTLYKLVSCFIDNFLLGSCELEGKHKILLLRRLRLNLVNTAALSTNTPEYGHLGLQNTIALFNDWNWM